MESRVPVLLRRAVAACALLASVAFAQPPRLQGYLASGRALDDTAFLPPPPAAGSPLAAADLAVYRETRALEGDPRWTRAASDNVIGLDALLADYRCALGVDLVPEEMPALSRMLMRAGADLFPLIGAAKDRYQRPRPFVLEPAAVCIEPSADLAESGAYPSGHAAVGWLYALLLAEIDPANAGAIVARGRAYGESRVVCGVHWVSDIDAGRTLATALVAALHGNGEFAGEVVAARTELAAMRARSAKRADAAACADEEGNLKTPW